MKAVAAICVLVSAWAAMGIAQEPVKPSGEEGRIIALESAWDQAEQNKDATALAGLPADNLGYVDYGGNLSDNEQLLEGVKSAAVPSEQTHNEGGTDKLVNEQVVGGDGNVMGQGRAAEDTSL